MITPPPWKNFQVESGQIYSYCCTVVKEDRFGRTVYSGNVLSVQFFTITISSLVIFRVFFCLSRRPTGRFWYLKKRYHRDVLSKPYRASSWKKRLHRDKSVYDGTTISLSNGKFLFKDYALSGKAVSPRVNSASATAYLGTTSLSWLRFFVCTYAKVLIKMH